MLRIPHYLYNRLTDGGKVVNPTNLPRSTSQKHYFSDSDLVQPEGLGELRKIIHLIGSLTRELPACSMVP
jgi:hypothetical protein